MRRQNIITIMLGNMFPNLIFSESYFDPLLETKLSTVKMAVFRVWRLVVWYADKVSYDPAAPVS